VGLRLLCFEKVAAAVNARFERAPVSTSRVKYFGTSHVRQAEASVLRQTKISHRQVGVALACLDKNMNEALIPLPDCKTNRKAS
jgi:hypothetical protein